MRDVPGLNHFSTMMVRQRFSVGLEFSSITEEVSPKGGSESGKGGADISALRYHSMHMGSVEEMVSNGKPVRGDLVRLKGEEGNFSSCILDSPRRVVAQRGQRGKGCSHQKCDQYMDECFSCQNRKE